jgi:hypothetical protein
MRFLAAEKVGFRATALAALAAILVPSGLARADEPRNATEPRVMMESGEVTNVIDAFDEGDAFDINISLGFEYSSKSAKILRENSIAQPGLTTGGFTAHTLNVASYSETTTKLVPRIDIGIYKDFAAHIALPLILSNARDLAALGGSDKMVPSVALAGAPGEQLFALPFKSPTRSGLEHIAAGLDVDLLSQARDRTKPTWQFGFEGRFSVGTPMHACNPSPKAGQVQCANPADVNRNGNVDNPASPAIALEGVDAAERKPGVSRGVMGLEVHTMISKRIKYIEPYGGFSALFEFQQKSSDYGISDVDATLVNHPPLVGTMTVGMMVIPWENREKFGRLTFDMRFSGQYHSEGRDYSELFDALGASDAASLRNPQWASYKANPDFINPCASSGCKPPSIVDTGSQKTYFTGLSDVSAFTSYRASGSVTWQANEYVKFNFGLGYRHDQGHDISGDPPCNPAKTDLATGGPCHTSGGGPNSTSPPTATGLANPNYRQSINAVGRRFFVDDSNTFDVMASGVVMF